MGNNSDDRTIIHSTGWEQRYAYVPVKLINGKWIWLKPYYARAFIGIDVYGFFKEIELADLFYVIANPVKSIF
jgi:hypothetical protein